MQNKNKNLFWIDHNEYGHKDSKSAVLIKGWRMDHRVWHKDLKSGLLNQGWTIEQEHKDSNRTLLIASIVSFALSWNFSCLPLHPPSLEKRILHKHYQTQNYGRKASVPM